MKHIMITLTALIATAVAALSLNVSTASATPSATYVVNGVGYWNWSSGDNATILVSPTDDTTRYYTLTGGGIPSGYYEFEQAGTSKCVDWSNSAQVFTEMSCDLLYTTEFYAYGTFGGVADSLKDDDTGQCVAGENLDLYLISVDCGSLSSADLSWQFFLADTPLR